MVSARLARYFHHGMPPAKAHERLRQAAQTGQLDKKLVESFIKAFEIRRGGMVIPVAERFRETAYKAS